MTKPSAAMPVYALVNAIDTNVVSAAHPTEAKKPNYKPPFRQQFHANTITKEEGRVLQHVGTAYLQEDGYLRIDLVDVPLSRTLYIKQS
jgi:hypothetical protein